MASELGFELLHLPGVFTRFPLGGTSRPLVIDIAFASSRLAPFYYYWDTSLPSTGLDHVPITISVSHPLLSPPLPSPNWALTDWDSLTPLLGDLVFPAPPHISKKKMCVRRIASASGRPVSARLAPYAWCV